MSSFPWHLHRLQASDYDSQILSILTRKAETIAGATQVSTAAEAFSAQDMCVCLKLTIQLIPGATQTATNGYIGAFDQNANLVDVIQWVPVAGDTYGTADVALTATWTGDYFLMPGMSIRAVGNFSAGAINNTTRLWTHGFCMPRGTIVEY